MFRNLQFASEKKRLLCKVGVEVLGVAIDGDFAGLDLFALDVRRATNLAEICEVGAVSVDGDKPVIGTGESDWVGCGLVDDAVKALEAGRLKDGDAACCARGGSGGKGRHLCNVEGGAGESECPA